MIVPAASARDTAGAGRDGALSLGIVGAGQITSAMHLPVLLARDDVRVAWIADADGTRARQVAAGFRIAPLALPVEPAGLPETDLLLLAIPYGAREAYYEAMAGRRTSLYVEKPLARTRAEHARLLLRFPGTRLACGLQRRSSGPVRLMRELVGSGLLGALRAMRIGHGTRGVLAGSAHATDIRQAGGGLILEVGIHLIDAGLFIAGAERARVDSGRMEREGGFDIHTHADLTLSGGAVDESVAVEVMVSGLVDTIQGIECRFDGGTVTFSASDGTVSARGVRDGLVLDLLPRDGPWPSTPYQIADAHWGGFLASVRTGAPNATSASRMVLTTEILEQLYGLP